MNIRQKLTVTLTAAAMVVAPTIVAAAPAAKAAYKGPSVVQTVSMAGANSVEGTEINGLFIAIPAIVFIGLGAYFAIDDQQSSTSPR